MSIKIPAITRMKKLANSQRGAFELAHLDKIVIQEYNQKQKEGEKQQVEKEQEPFEFNPEELDANVETLVLRNKNSFKDRLSVQNNNTQTKQEVQNEIKEPKQNKDSEIEK